MFTRVQILCIFTTSSFQHYLFQAFKLQRRRATQSSSSPSFTVHTIKDASPIHDNPNYVHLYDLHNEIFFIVDSASPKSILPPNEYREQAQTLHNIPSLFASNDHPLSVYGCVDLLLQFEELPHQHVTHTFIVADVQCPILGYDF